MVTPAVFRLPIGSLSISALGNVTAPRHTSEIGAACGADDENFVISAKGRTDESAREEGLGRAAEAIYILRHGEKPADPEPSGHGKPPDAPYGVDIEGNHSPHSLVPRGWQRAGGLVALFDPASGGAKTGLLAPTVLLSPAHGSPGKTAGHRTYQTIEGLGGRLGIEIDSTFARARRPRWPPAW